MLYLLEISYIHHAKTLLTGKHPRPIDRSKTSFIKSEADMTIPVVRLRDGIDIIII